MHYNFNNTTLFFFLIIVFTFTVNDAYAAYYTTDVVMEKNTNGSLIFVSKDTAPKLVERGYAKETIDFAKICNTTMIEIDVYESNCGVKIITDVRFCVLIINSTDPCIWEFDRPKTIKECEQLYKIFSVYNLFIEGYNTPDEYFRVYHFGTFTYFCEMPITLTDSEAYQYEFVHEKITQNYEFIFLDGIPQSLDFRIGGGDETDPVQLYGGGTFQNATHTFDFYFRTWQYYVWELDIYEIT